jgi:O-antigen/teichoic acid export membrane protein
MATSTNRSAARVQATAAVYIGFAILQRGISILLLPFVTRAMPPAEYGAVSVIVAIGLLASAVFGGPVEMGVFRWTARSGDQHPALLRIARIHLFVVVPLIGTGIALALYLVQSVAFGASTTLIGLEILALCLGAAFTYFTLPLVRASDRVGVFALLASINIVVLVASKVTLVIVLSRGVEGWVTSDLIAGASSFVVAIFVSKIDRPRVGRSDVGSFLRFCLPLTPHRISFWALSSLSRPMAALTLTLSAVGVFSLALNLAAVASLVLGELNRAVLIEYSRESFPAPTHRTSTVIVAQVVAALVVPAAIGVGIAVAHPWLLGSEYESALPLVAILLLGQFAYGVYLVPMNFLVQTAGYAGLSWIASTVGASAIFLLLLVLPDSAGTRAVSWVNMLGYVLMMALSFGLVIKHRLVVRWAVLLDHRVLLGSSVGAMVLAFWSLSTSSREQQLVAAIVGLTLFVIVVLGLLRAQRPRQFVGKAFQ